MPALTNTGAQPIGIAGLLGPIEPGETRDMPDKAWDAAKGKPVVAFWLKAGILVAASEAKPKKAKADVTE